MKRHSSHKAYGVEFFFFVTPYQMFYPQYLPSLLHKPSITRRTKSQHVETFKTVFLASHQLTKTNQAHWNYFRTVNTEIMPISLE